MKAFLNRTAVGRYVVFPVGISIITFISVAACFFLYLFNSCTEHRGVKACFADLNSALFSQAANQIIGEAFFLAMAVFAVAVLSTGVRDIVAVIRGSRTT
jgi:hypothetical protein